MSVLLEGRGVGRYSVAEISQPSLLKQSLIWRVARTCLDKLACSSTTLMACGGGVYFVRHHTLSVLELSAKPESTARNTTKNVFVHDLISPPKVISHQSITLCVCAAPVRVGCLLQVQSCSPQRKPSS